MAAATSPSETSPSPVLRRESIASPAQCTRYRRRALPSAFPKRRSPESVSVSGKERRPAWWPDSALTAATRTWTSRLRWTVQSAGPAPDGRVRSKERSSASRGLACPDSETVSPDGHPPDSSSCLRTRMPCPRRDAANPQAVPRSCSFEPAPKKFALRHSSDPIRCPPASADKHGKR